MTSLAPRRRLGCSDLSVHPLCLGGNVFGWTADEAQSFAVLDAYSAAGGNFVDTADVYSADGPGSDGGLSELIIGRWMRRRGRREDVVIATKVGGRGGLSPTNIRAGVESSLRRLQVEQIDLLYAHMDDRSTPLEDTVAAFGQLVQAGWVRHVAAANYSVERLKLALNIAKAGGYATFVALSTQYNLLERRWLREDRFGTEGFEGRLRDLCIGQDIACLPYWVLAKGVLTGKYGTRGHKVAGPQVSARGALIRPEDLDAERSIAVLKVLTDVAREHEVTVAAVATAWTARQPGVIAPIVSARTTSQVSELLSFMHIDFTAAELSALDAVSSDSADRVVRCDND
ncbi:aldo/keto reductase [uncultured Jatrophihabitans sp.]|uniref:aldo/keto reductase n=1 Tax=uncultured Jatrophihabitans sp. TaxID=1610747 RepID=UPI0035CAEC82